MQLSMVYEMRNLLLQISLTTSACNRNEYWRWLQPKAQVHGLVPRVSGRLALFCIHRMNWVYGSLVVTSWTWDMYLRRLTNCRINIIIIINNIRNGKISALFPGPLAH